MTLDWPQFYDSLLPLIPAETDNALTVIGPFLVALCAIVARFWPRPASGPEWLALYGLINRIAMNSKHTANADETKEPRR